MKRFYTLIVAVVITSAVFAQAPSKMSYQAVVRDAGDALVTGQVVGMQLSIVQDSVSGTVVYVETQTPTSNLNGLVSVEIGSGTVVSGTFNSIDWSKGLYFIKTETDPTGGTMYTITGTSELMSVPYALHANTADSIVGGKIDSTDIAAMGFVAGSATTLTIGQSYQGGKIFWLDASGQHGLIAATADQSTGIQWYNGSNTTTNAVRDGIGAGKFNTERIIANQGSGAYAAQICANYQGGNYGDWYLPSKYELNLLYLQKTVVGGFVGNYYWSSNEYDNYDAWDQDFTNGGGQGLNCRPSLAFVRAVRAF
jgi:hypothetical protein